jgi:transcriptional regulator with XRE-family HTH domain
VQKIKKSMAIENNIRKLRIAKNISQQTVADSLNIDRLTYAAWEQGAQDIKNMFIPKIADFFEVEIAELFENDRSIQISQTFKNSSVNTAILIITDNTSIGNALDAIKHIDKK